MQDAASAPPTSASSCEYSSLQVNINERLRLDKSRSLAPTEEELHQPTKRLRPTMDGFKPLHILRRAPPPAYPLQMVHNPIIYVDADPPTPTNHNLPPEERPPDDVQPTHSLRQPTCSPPTRAATSNAANNHGRPPEPTHEQPLPPTRPPTTTASDADNRSGETTKGPYNYATCTRPSPSPSAPCQTLTSERA